MLIRLVCFLSIFSIFSALSFEVHGLEFSKTLTTEVDGVASVESDLCDDCKEDGCSEAEDCCTGLCSCVSTYLTCEEFQVSELYSRTLSKVRWHFFSSYRLPYLDPALKPPLYS